MGSDAARKQLVQFTLDKFGAIDIFVSNAAVNPAIGGVLDVSINISHTSFFSLVKSCLPYKTVCLFRQKKVSGIRYSMSM